MRVHARRLLTTACTYDGEAAERTLVLFKPDTLQRALLGSLVS